MVNEPTAIITLLIVAFTGVFTYLGLQHREFMERYIFNPRYVSAHKDYYRLISSGFLHLDWQHFAFNMLTLYFFGSNIENLLGFVPLLLIYFASILGGNILALYFHRHHEYRAVGASGGVCGVLFSAIFLFPGSSIFLMFIPIPIPSWLFAMLYLGYTFWGIRTGKDNIGHDAHLGGALVGILVATVMYPRIVVDSPVLYFGVLGSSCAFFYVLRRHPFAQFKQLIVSGEKQHEPMAHRYSKSRKIKQREIDRILDKISAHGVGSLTPEEKAMLDRFSNRK